MGSIDYKPFPHSDKSFTGQLKAEIFAIYPRLDSNIVIEVILEVNSLKENKAKISILTMNLKKRGLDIKIGTVRRVVRILSNQHDKKLTEPCFYFEYTKERRFFHLHKGKPFQFPRCAIELYEELKDISKRDHVDRKHLTKYMPILKMSIDDGIKETYINSYSEAIKKVHSRKLDPIVPRSTAKRISLAPRGIRIVQENRF